MTDASESCAQSDSDDEYSLSESEYAYTDDTSDSESDISDEKTLVSSRRPLSERNASEEKGCVASPLSEEKKLSTAVPPQQVQRKRKRYTLTAPQNRRTVDTQALSSVRHFIKRKRARSLSMGEKLDIISVQAYLRHKQLMQTHRKGTKPIVNITGHVSKMMSRSSKTVTTVWREYCKDNHG